VPKILVADDNANIQKMVSLSFEDRGIHVVAVGNGEAAVRRIPDLQPDLVLADIFMPVRNGYEVCEFVKKDERFSHVPVILLVGAFDPLDEKEARRVGADGVLKKPFVPPDPLIAMVMSALEKNPKIAAELAKAKEAKAVVAPPEPVSAPIPEPPNSARAEVKPLPDFPEPSAEEAALIYGFGTGKRTLEDQIEDAAAGPKPPAAPATEQEDEAGEEFEGAATSRDWRRNAMDFDIPADQANKPAFASHEDLEPSMFPSERDVPPRHVRVPEPEEEPAAPAKVSEAVQAEPAKIEHPIAEEPDAEYFTSFSAPAVGESVSNKAAAEPTPVIEPEPPAESAPRSEPKHWMDQLAQGSSEQPRTDWMSVLSEQSAEPQSLIPAAPEAPRQEASAEPIPPAPAEETEDVEHFNSNPWSTSESSSIPQAKSEEPFFADEPAANASNDSWLSPAARAAESAHEVIETTSSDAVPLAASKTDDNFEVDSDFTPPISGKDPALVEPPAVHVTPEPLLVQDEPQASSEYGSHSEEREPLHSFFAPPSPSSAVDEAPAHEFSARIEPPVAVFEPESLGPSERIPTGPPPNREVLAEIPFLSPPPEFRAQAREQAISDPGTVDAVVQKVLEKLEPQLHDLLSQGVLKPLVENLLQNEVAKKAK